MGGNRKGYCKQRSFIKVQCKYCPSIFSALSKNASVCDKCRMKKSAGLILVEYKQQMC